ncbi:MAG TPA: hypothetical protein DCY35_06855, partial [Prolixibacteraceae bacterium]|nr:hypothetical protein [Prolixibacteraceae bacterium]
MSNNMLLMKMLILLINFLLVIQIYGQKTVTGIIKDGLSGEPISYALISTGPNKSYTNSDGRFSIPYEPVDSVISVAASFYLTTEVLIPSADIPLHIFLYPEEQNIEAITVSANRIESRLLNSTSGISLLTSSQIARNSPVALEPSLNQVPGVFMHSGSFNTNRITIRGIGSRSAYGTSKIRAYLDDIPLTSGDGQTTLEDLSPQSFSQVEVIRGPTSGIHGSGLGGAILLKSMPGSEALKISAQFVSASFGTHKEGITFSSNGKSSSHLLITDFLYSDGYRENNQYNRSNLFSYNQFKLGNKDRLTVLFNFIDLKAYIPSSIDLTTFLETPQKAAANWASVKGNEDVRKIRGAISFNHHATDKMEIVTTANIAHSENIELRPFNLLTEENLSFSGRVSFKIKGHRTEWNTGLESFRESYNWETYRNQSVHPAHLLSENQEIRFWTNLFSQLRWQIKPDLTIEPGFNLNYTHYNYSDLFVEDGDASGVKTFPLLLSPRLGVNYQYTSKSAIYSVASHGFSSPSLQETLQPDGQVNPEIEPETGWNMEIGWRGKMAQNKLFLDLAIYQMRIRNLLVARRTGEDAFVGVNAGKTIHNGIEYDLRYYAAPIRNVKWNFYSNGTIAKYYFEEFMDLENDFSGNQLTGVPSLVLNNGFEIRTSKGWSALLSHRYTSRLALNDA